MSLILCIDSSSLFCSAALFDNEQCIAVEVIEQPRSAAGQLAVAIKSVLQSSGADGKMLNAVCVTSGPGSYTGLRIGVAMAKGLCYALGLPLISVNTLELLTSQVQLIYKDKFSNSANILYCPMLDARRMEVYCSLLDCNLNYKLPIEAVIIDETSFINQLEHNSILFFGDGSSKCKSKINHPNAFFLPDINPRADFMGRLALEKFRNSIFEDLITFEPFYLKDFLIKKPNAI